MNEMREIACSMDRTDRRSPQPARQRFVKIWTNLILVLVSLTLRPSIGLEQTRGTADLKRVASAADYRKAVKELSKGLKQAPRYAAGWTMLADAEEGAENPSGAASALRTYPIAAPSAGDSASVSARIAQLEQQAVKQRQQAEKLRKPAEIKNQKTPVGHTFRDCPECPEMMVVPAGSFMMGKSYSQHRVIISSNFAVGKYPVTRDEYGRFVAESGYSADKGWQNPGFSQSGNHPVVNVNWNDADEYVRWLSQKTGKRYRLLSEAEYEYAERANTTTDYYWGNDRNDGCRHANSSECHHNGTDAVGSYPANAFGLYDMAGNIWEWVEDCYHSSYHGAPSDGSAWTSGDCGYRVMRGCSWHNCFSSLLRSAFRNYWNPSDRNNFGGFRVARTL